VAERLEPLSVIKVIQTLKSIRKLLHTDKSQDGRHQRSYITPRLHASGKVCRQIIHHTCNEIRTAAIFEVYMIRVIRSLDTILESLLGPDIAGDTNSPLECTNWKRKEKQSAQCGWQAKMAKRVHIRDYDLGFFLVI